MPSEAMIPVGPVGHTELSGEFGNVIRFSFGLRHGAADLKNGLRRDDALGVCAGDRDPATCRDVDALQQLTG